MRDSAAQQSGEIKNSQGDYALIERAIDLLRSRATSPPTLQELASQIGLSPSQLQKLFSRWAGISPKRFLQVQSLSYGRSLLRRSMDVLGTSLDLGLSSPGRLHDLFVTLEAVSPGEFQRQGEGLEIRHGFHETPLGRCLIGVTARGICSLEFPADEPDLQAVQRLAKNWPKARLVRSVGDTGLVISRIFANGARGPTPFHLLVRGTNFQVQVWRALLRIPAGHLVSYARVAQWAGYPSAHRATGTAVGQNPISILIPCHRVLRGDGHIGGYRWGVSRKLACLAWEQRESETPA